MKRTKVLNVAMLRLNILLVISENACNFKQFKNFVEIHITISGHFTPEQFVISKLCWINSCVIEFAKLNSYILTIDKLTSISNILNKGNPHIFRKCTFKIFLQHVRNERKKCVRNMFKQMSIVKGNGSLTLVTWGNLF